MFRPSARPLSPHVRYLDKQRHLEREIDADAPGSARMTASGADVSQDTHPAALPTIAPRSYYFCQSCNRVVDWHTDEISSDAEVEVKTIESRYCYRCIPREAEANGLSIAQIVEHRLQQGRPI